MPGVMRGDAVLLNRGNQGMVGDTGVVRCDRVEHLSDGRGPLGRNRDVAMFEAVNGLIARASRGQKNNGRSQTLVTQDVNEIDWMDGRRHEAKKYNNILPKAQRRQDVNALDVPATCRIVSPD